MISSKAASFALRATDPVFGHFTVAATVIGEQVAIITFLSGSNNAITAYSVTSVKGIVTDHGDLIGERERVVLDYVIVFVLEDAIPTGAYDGTVVDTRNTLLHILRAFGQAIKLAHGDDLASREGCVASEGDLETFTLSYYTITFKAGDGTRVGCGLSATFNKLGFTTGAVHFTSFNPGAAAESGISY